MARYGTARSPEVKLEPGAYVLTLQGFRDAHEPRGRFADLCNDHKAAGARPTDPRCPRCQYEDDVIHNVYWQFVEDQGGDKIELRGSASCGEKSNFLKNATALCGGKAPCSAGDTSYDWELLINRKALGNITVNDRGYCRLSSISPLPKGMGGNGATKATPDPNTLLAEAEVDDGALDEEAVF